MPLASADIQKLIHITREAGRCILSYHGKPDAHGTRRKEDRSPVTEADMASHKYIVEALARDFPAIPVISEEDASPAALDTTRPYFLVDPLDGTRAFMRGEDEFTVNICLMENLRPAFGIIGVPMHKLLFFGGQGVPAGRQEKDQSPEPVRVRAVPEEEGVIVTRSSSQLSEEAKKFIESLGEIDEIIPASSAIKFCWLAEGSADVYPRFGRTMEWDTAAGHAILDAAGGCITLPDGAPLLYNKPKLENGPFIACGGWRPSLKAGAPRHPRNHVQG